MVPYKPKELLSELITALPQYQSSMFLGVDSTRWSGDEVDKRGLVIGLRKPGWPIFTLSGARGWPNQYSRSPSNNQALILWLLWSGKGRQSTDSECYDLLFSFIICCLINGECKDELSSQITHFTNYPFLLAGNRQANHLHSTHWVWAVAWIPVSPLPPPLSTTGPTEADKINQGGQDTYIISGIQPRSSEAGWYKKIGRDSNIACVT